MPRSARSFLLICLAGLTLGILAAPATGSAAPKDAGRWAKPAADRLTALGLWSGAVPSDLSRPAPRRALARGIDLLLTAREGGDHGPAELVPVPLPPPGAPTQPPASSMPLTPATPVPEPTTPSLMIRDVRADDRDRAAIERAISLRLIGLRSGAFAPAKPLTMGQARLALVRAFGLDAERASIQGLAGYKMPAFAGSEVLARELGLVENHLERNEARERQASETMSWAELFSLLNRARQVDDWDIERMSVYRQITLPSATPAERKVIQAALGQIGRPYVWGGDSPSRQGKWGSQAAAGFDCSGLVWWAYASTGQGSRIHGWRGTADDFAYSAGARRISTAAAGAGDLVFYGSKGPRTRKGAIEHVGISLGGGWMIHSSGSRGGPSLSYMPNYWTSGEVFARAV